MIKYFYTDGKDKFGPFSKDELKSQKITRTTKVWYFGLNEWVQLEKVESLNDILLAIPPEIKSINYINKNEFAESASIILNSSKNKSRRVKWLIGGALALILSLITWRLVIKQSDVFLKEEVVSNSYNSDVNFEEYINKYYRDLEYFGIFPKKPKEVIVKFSRLDQLDNTAHLHGISYGLNDDDKIEIYINPSSWFKFSKSMRYYLMYHELSHDILNLKDLDAIQENKGKLMYPELSSYENKNMDEFIESYHALFKEHSKK